MNAVSRSMRSFLALAVGVGLFGWPQALFAQAAFTQAAEEEFELRTFEVGALIIDIQDHPYSDSLGRRLPQADRSAVGATAGKSAQIQFAQFGGGGGGMGGGGGYGGMGGGYAPAAGPSGNPNQITMGDLIDVIVSTVDPGTWNESKQETGKGEIQPLGTTLVVWNKPAVHKQLSSLLDNLFQASGERKTVTIDARWLSLTSDELDALLPTNGNEQAAIDREQLERFTRRPTSIRGITNCFSSQLVYLISGTRRNVVSGYIPVVGSLDFSDSGERLVSLSGEARIRFASESSSAAGESQRSVGYQPLTKTMNFGSLLEIRPTVMPNKTAIVDLKTTLTGPGEPTDNSSVFESRSLAPAVDRTAINTQELATTMRVSLGKPTLVGGLTDASRPSSPAAEDGRRVAGQASDKPAEMPQMYLILELR